jgi:hypothetical protein
MLEVRDLRVSFVMLSSRVLLLQEKGQTQNTHDLKNVHSYKNNGYKNVWILKNVHIF